ncbi:MAG: hypothetical protein AAGF06_04220 [Pseudomonadota bacterium]
MKKSLTFIALKQAAYIGFVATILSACQPQKLENTLDGSPLDNLPTYITKLTDEGSRADWARDGKKLLYIKGTEKSTLGQVHEIDIETKEVTNLTDGYTNYGYTRAMYLANGDLLLCGPEYVDPLSTEEDAGRLDAVLWVHQKPFDKEPVNMKEKCWEGPSVANNRMRIGWVDSNIDWDNPIAILTGYSKMFIADIVYIDGKPTLDNKKQILDRKDVFPFALETQSFRPPNDNELIYNIYAKDNGTVQGINLDTGKTTKYSNSKLYEEAEGIFPDGKMVTVERDLRPIPIPTIIDIWTLSLDEEATYKRLTYFSYYKGFGASNPVIRGDGRYMAFQLKDANGSHGAGLGILLFDFDAYNAHEDSKK